MYKPGNRITAFIGRLFSPNDKQGWKCTVEVDEIRGGDYYVTLMDTGISGWPSQGESYVTTGKDGWFTFVGLANVEMEDPSCI